MRTKKTAEASPELNILRVNQGRVTIGVLGVSELVMNRLSEKARHELLFPARKTKNHPTDILKHNPYEEFQAAPHKLPDGPTLLAMPSTAFKKALSSAAVELPETSKAQIGRLTWVLGRYVHIYGYPKLYMAPVRNSDINHTPDIRTRVIVPEWCAEVTISFVQPKLTQNAIANLLYNAGLIIGIGDGRQEKGTLSFGQFHLVPPTDKDFLRIKKYGGRKAQEAGMKAAEPYDEETRELYSWFTEEVKRRNYEKPGNIKVAMDKKKVNGSEVVAKADEDAVSA
jgi:hypothetical protein